MVNYCVDFGEGKFFNIDAERFEICESGYCYFYLHNHIICSVNWDLLKQIDEFYKVDNKYHSIKTIWTHENGFSAELDNCKYK